jgi:pimeloyl-ACP methyl ester carboxylesterase
MQKEEAQAVGERSEEVQEKEEVAARPRLLLCPQFTEVEWAIAPQLAEWAEVATFDAPGVGDEPLPTDRSVINREAVVKRGTDEVNRMGWDSFFVIGDAWGNSTAVRLAIANSDRVLGIALGHASPDYGAEGDRPAVNGEVVAAMTQLLRSDYDSFIRYGFTQFTQGGFDEDTAGRMVDRFPPMDVATKAWEMLVSTPEPIAELLARCCSQSTRDAWSSRPRAMRISSPPSPTPPP